ncbi:MAG: hypothetical protein AB2A00_24570 [Myxococcota bacterium]
MRRVGLLTRLTEEEIDQGTELVNALQQQVFGRVAALNEQIEKKYARSKVYTRGMELAKLVLDAVELEFRGAEQEPLRDLFPQEPSGEQMDTGCWASR